MKIDLTKYSINELVELRGQVNELIYGYKDDYLYICSVRQFGSVWEETPQSLVALKELCNEYSGENGIVDVYTNNPNLKFPEMEFYNYGNTMYIKSEYDYREWVKYESSIRGLNNMSESVHNWEIRDELPFFNRPTFQIWCREDLEEEIRSFETKSWDFVKPIPLIAIDE